MVKEVQLPIRSYKRFGYIYYDYACNGCGAEVKGYSHQRIHGHVWCRECLTKRQTEANRKRMIKHNKNIMQWQPAAVQPTDEDAEYILCISGKIGNITYDRGIEMCECYWENDRGWFIHGYKKPEDVIVHAWMIPEPYQE